MLCIYLFQGMPSLRLDLSSLRLEESNHSDADPVSECRQIEYELSKQNHPRLNTPFYDKLRDKYPQAFRRRTSVGMSETSSVCSELPTPRSQQPVVTPRSSQTTPRASNPKPAVPAKPKGVKIIQPTGQGQSSLHTATKSGSSTAQSKTDNLNRTPNSGPARSSGSHPAGDESKALSQSWAMPRSCLHGLEDLYKKILSDYNNIQDEKARILAGGCTGHDTNATSAGRRSSQDGRFASPESQDSAVELDSASWHSNMMRDPASQSQRRSRTPKLRSGRSSPYIQQQIQDMASDSELTGYPGYGKLMHENSM